VTEKPESTLRDSDAVLGQLSQMGLLLLSDPKRISAIQILTGAPPRGSWWSHPAAHQIYGILQEVEGHPDVLSAKLLAGKVTFVHRALWPALLAVVTAREPWQVKDLLPGSAEWLATLDQAVLSGSELPQPSRTVMKEIEARLLARGESVHTGEGRHETRLEPWPTWAARAGCPPVLGLSSTEGKLALAAAAERLGPPAPLFPWNE
jgi:hypothetical protein